MTVALDLANATLLASFSACTLPRSSLPPPPTLSERRHLRPRVSITTKARDAIPGLHPSLLRLNVWRRMVMSDCPFVAAFCQQHSKPRWCGHWFAVRHPGEQIESCHDDGAIA